MNIFLIVIACDYIAYLFGFNGINGFCSKTLKYYRRFSDRIHIIDDNRSRINRIKKFIKMMINITLLRISQYFNNFVNKGFGGYDIRYVYENKIYKIHIKNDILTPEHDIVKVISMKSKENITDYFLQYLGPNYDFHNMKYTPKDIGLDESITIIFSGEKKKLISKNDIITLNT